MNKIIHSLNLTKIYGEKETSVTALDDINVEFKENSATTYTALHTNANLNFNEVQLYINVPGTTGFDTTKYIHNSGIGSAVPYDFRIFGTSYIVECKSS